ncbi:hypothetical protein ACQZ5N_21440 [Agrobacterium sp. 22-221-1]|uniref:hypothetical protein n=1 Tax=Agrobacterium leguminum TaxID=2792015 RepID=UPI003CE59553
MRRYLSGLAVLFVMMTPQMLAAQETVGGNLSAQAAAIVRQLGLSDIDVYNNPGHGEHVRGKLPDGSWVKVDFDRRRALEEVESDDHTGFKAKAVESLIPAAVRASPSYPADALLWKVEFDDDDRIEMKGRRTDGMRFEAEFTTDGRLVEIKKD